MNKKTHLIWGWTQAWYQSTSSIFEVWLVWHQWHPYTRQSDPFSTCLPKWFATSQVQGACATALAAVWMRKALEYYLSPVIALWVFISNRWEGNSTFKISLTLATHSQSLSVRENADYGIFFSMWPLQWIVMTGPYKELADWRNKLIGCTGNMLVQVWEWDKYYIYFVTCMNIQACAAMIPIECCYEDES